jgi:hypothetical protein
MARSLCAQWLSNRSRAEGQRPVESASAIDIAVPVPVGDRPIHQTLARCCGERDCTDRISTTFGIVITELSFSLEPSHLRS